ncbi:MAG: ABC transporter permease [Prevotella sp.]|nr:ABC transporter permease [Prevotella sp.]
MKPRRLLRRLLSRNLTPFQLAGFVLANLLGMTIVLTSVQFSADVLPLLTGNDGLMKPGQVVIVKQVSALRTLSGVAPVFKESEINILRQQPFVKDVGRFTPSQFNVFATIGGGSMGMQFSTEMFFESVPDEYLDVDLSKWQYKSGSDTLPIILPRTYLNLYNFGFAGSRGLPTISEGLVGAVNLHLLLSGTHGQRRMTGKVVAFSRRLNTILVPQSFMDEANRSLSPVRLSQPSRLILKVNNPADERIASFLHAQRYDTETNDADASRTVGFFRLLSMVVMGVGLLITFLSFYVLLLSIYLLLQKHTDKIDSLLLIGYAPGGVAVFYNVLAVGLNAIVLISSFVLVFFIRDYYLPQFGELYPGYSPSAFAPSLIAGLLLFFFTSLFNFVAIRRKIIRVWQMHKT